MTKVRASDFHVDHFELSEVWTWSRDIKDDEDLLVPVHLSEDELSQADSLLIHSQFKTQSGCLLEGLVVYDVASDEVFAIEVLHNGQRFTLNRYAPDLSEGERNRLASSLRLESTSLHSIDYSIVPRELAIDDGVFLLGTQG